MTENMRVITRRDFIRGVATAAFAAAVGFPIEAQSAEKRARVVLIRDAGVLDSEGKINISVFGRMLDQAVAKLLGKPDAASAWKSIVKPSDFVGIKTNVWNRFPTPPEVNEILMKRVIAAGVSEDRVFCDDRGSRDKFEQATALINVRPARAHTMAGMGGCIKNYIILSGNPASYHEDACADLAKVWNLPIVKGKTRLNILLLLNPLFYCKGPQAYDPRYVWPYKGLAVSLDPVAVDSVAAHILRAKRIAFFGEDKPITPTKHIAIADERYNLGVADLNRIELIRLGWRKDAQI